MNNTDVISSPLSANLIPAALLEQRIMQRLTETFAPIQYRLDNESHLHAGHAGAASGGQHYRLMLVSERFAGCSRVARHRLVYDCLADLMQSAIHALTIVALAPLEATASGKSPDKANAERL